MHRNGFFVFFLAVASVASACGNDDDSSSTDTGDGGNFDEMVSGVSVEVHEQVNTVLVVTWTQDVAADEVWLRYTFEDDEWYESPARAGELGAHEEIVLGTPKETEVTIHIVSRIGDDEVESEAYEGVTGTIPSEFPHVSIQDYNESQASPNRWMLGSVEAGEHYEGPFYVFIMDRKGRVVWYYGDPAPNPIIGFPRISRDGRYIFFGHRYYSGMYTDTSRKVVKMTLDWKYYEEIQISLADNVDMTDSGSLLYNTLSYVSDDSWLVEHMPDGTERNIWDCYTLFYDVGSCYSNTVNWDPVSDTVLMSFPYVNTVVQIDRETGDVVGQYGQEPGSYTFDPDHWGFDFQHYPNITPEGTLMVSSHIPALEGKHAFMEFQIDRENQVLIEEWVYREGDEFADTIGEAFRIPNGNGNVLGNYGSDGVIREITPEKLTVWYVKFFELEGGDLHKRLIGHCTMLDDLYALNRGPE